MGRERNAQWYERRMGEARYEWYASPFLLVYIKVAAALPSPFLAPVLMDVGCGNGIFASLLYGLGYLNYTGIDFNAKAILHCQRKLPDYRWLHRDLKNPQTLRLFRTAHHLIFMEVLEHIENDLQVIRNVPRGRNIYLTVPSYDSEGHVRIFATMDEAVERYIPYMDIGNKQAIELWENKKWFFLRGKRNGNTV